jgi:DNA-binding beta-propeller fold protein YncE
MGRAGRTAWAIALVATAALLVGCGSDGDSETGADGGGGGDAATDDSVTDDDSSGGAGPDLPELSEGISVTSPSGIAATSDTIWVSSYDDDVVLPIDPESHEVGEPIDVGDGPVRITADGDDLWVANDLDTTISHVDTTTGEVVGTIEANARDLVARDGVVWAYTGGDIVRIDQATDQIVATIDVPSGFGSIALADDGTVWSTNHFEGLLLGIDPRTDAIADEIALGEDGDDDLAGVAVVGDTVWVIASHTAELIPVDAATGEVGARIDASTLNHPYQLIAEGDRLVVGEDTGGWAVLEPPSPEALDSSYRPAGDSTYALLEGEIWQAGRFEDVVYPPSPTDD